MSTAMIWQTVSTSSDDTERLGQALGSLLKSPETVELISDLGGGKTTFVRGLARGLGSRDIVTSPTFTLSRIYKAKNAVELHHYDFYRLKEAGIMKDELAESLADSKVITVIEWANVVSDVLPPDHLTIEFRPIANNPAERQISISYSESKVGLMKKLETNWQESRS